MLASTGVPAATVYARVELGNQILIQRRALARHRDIEQSGVFAVDRVQLGQVDLVETELARRLLVLVFIVVPNVVVLRLPLCLDVLQ